MIDLTTATVSKGSHAESNGRTCEMELVALWAGLPKTDRPLCACPIITAAIITLNDAMPDDDTRTRLLLPLTERIATSKSTRKVERARAYIAADWACRVFAPLALDAAGLASEAATLRALPQIVDRGTAAAALSAARSADSAADSAAQSAALSAAYSADSAARSAHSAAYSAARSAARSAESAARSAHVAAMSAHVAAQSAAVAKAWELARDMVVAMLDCAA